MSSNKKNPTKINLLIKMEATAYLYDNKTRQTKTIKQVIGKNTGSEYNNVLYNMQHFSEPLESVQYVINKKILTKKPTASWDRENVTVDIPIKVTKSEKDIKNVLDDVDIYVSGFRNGASDGYLEGNAVIYKSYGIDYEFVIDNIVIKIIKDGTTIKKLKYDNYWRR
jgi:hypothetical protein